MDRGGYVKCPHMSTRGGEGVKNGQNLVHVVVECPLSLNSFERLLDFSQQYDLLTDRHNIPFAFLNPEGFTV